MIIKKFQHSALSECSNICSRLLLRKR